MPRTSHKKRLLNPHKSQLLFVEAPINGPKHEYGPQLRSAIHPRSFISEKQQQSGAPYTSWVCACFATLTFMLCVEWRLFFINWCIFFVYRCLHSLIHLRPQRLVEGRELTRQLRKSQTRCQFWVYLRLEKEGAANILPCPLMQPQAVKTFIVHGRRMIGSFLQTIIKRNFKKPQEELSFLEKGWRGRWLDRLHLLPPGVNAFHSV